MNPQLVNETSFSTVNPASYSLAEIWPFHTSSGENGVDKGMGLAIGWGVEGAGNCNMSIDDSTVTERSGCRRKMKDSASEDDSSKLLSSSSDNNANNGKRMKVTVCSDQRNDGSKGEAEECSKVDKKAAEEAKSSEPQKHDYIHVRARRGQATDSHSLAERARREKISERMKILQDLVPGCNKVIGKASVLDEIINYIQALQRQVEFLSMKLETVTEKLNRTISEFTPKELGGGQTFDGNGMMYSASPASEYVQVQQGSQTQWLHMQVGSTSFQRAS